MNLSIAAIASAFVSLYPVSAQLVNMPDLDRFYGSLHDYVRMVTRGYSQLLMLDARGGLGKTYNVRSILEEECDGDSNSTDEWIHQSGFTTPIELFKTLWKSRHADTVLFLDDMSGIAGNQKAVDMLKAATDTDGSENVVQYRSSRDIEHPFMDGVTLPNTFTFRGRIIMSFNDTPDTKHFEALKDRGTYYEMCFNYQERLDLIREITCVDEISGLSIEKQVETAEWIADVTDASYDVTIRTFEEICTMREFAGNEGGNWKKMAYDLFDMDWIKHRIISMRDDGVPIQKQCEELDISRGTYYDRLDELRNDRGTV